MDDRKKTETAAPWFQLLGLPSHKRRRAATDREQETSGALDGQVPAIRCSECLQWFLRPVFLLTSGGMCSPWPRMNSTCSRVAGQGLLGTRVMTVPETNPVAAPLFAQEAVPPEPQPVLRFSASYSGW